MAILQVIFTSSICLLLTPTYFFHSSFHPPTIYYINNNNNNKKWKIFCSRDDNIYFLNLVVGSSDFVLKVQTEIARKVTTNRHKMNGINV